MIKVYWKVSEPSSGTFRSFQRRGWPTAYYDKAHTKIMATIACDDSYLPSRAKSGGHAELILRVADHSVRHEDGRPTFVWRQLKKRFKTLKSIKMMLPDWMERSPNFIP